MDMCSSDFLSLIELERTSSCAAHEPRPIARHTVSMLLPSVRARMVHSVCAHDLASVVRLFLPLLATDDHCALVRLLAIAALVCLQSAILYRAFQYACFSCPRGVCPFVCPRFCAPCSTLRSPVFFLYVCVPCPRGAQRLRLFSEAFDGDQSDDDGVAASRGR